MSLLSLPPQSGLWLVALLPLAVVIVLIVWVTLRDRKKWAYRQQTGDMLLDRLQQANAQLSAVVKAETDAIQSIAVLPEDIDPLEAERVLRAAMPDSSFHDRRALMQHAWEGKKLPQALVAIAGMALADLENTYARLNLLFRAALKEGSPALLDHIARELGQKREGLDNWIMLSLPFELERAAQRVSAKTPDVATRVRGLAEELTPRWRELLMDRLRFEIGQWEDRDDLEPLDMAAGLAKSCLPRFPELATAAHAALGRHEGAEWEKAHVWLDKAILHHFYDVPVGLDGFDYDGAVQRLCDGIGSSNADVSLFYALHGADMLGDVFFDTPDHYDALQTALDRAVSLHGSNPTYEWLEKELNPVDVSTERLSAAEDNIALHASVNEGVGTVVETTSTLDPAVALAELRAAMPDAPAEMLRVAFTARWQVDRSPMSLVALLGVALEVIETEPVDGKMVSLCLHWPLRDGAADVVTAAVVMLEHRFERLDSWMHWERSIIDLEGAAKRMTEVALTTGEKAAALLARAKDRRVTLLAASIAARLDQAVAEGDKADPFKMMLDVYRWCLPDHPELGAPVRAMLEARSEDVEWGRVQMLFEGAVIRHFGEQGRLGGYDFDAAMRLLHAGIKAHDERIAETAAMTASDLVRRGLIATQEQFWILLDALDWAVPLHPVPLKAFEDLRAAIAAARATGES